MSSLQAAEKKERSLAEIILVVLLVALLMASFISYFFKHQEQLSRAGFSTISQVFSARVNAIRGQWFMDNQPRFVYTLSPKDQVSGAEKVKIPVNKKGWVDAGDSPLSCQAIWQHVMATPLQYMKQPIGAVWVEQNNDSAAYCQYSLPSGEYFTYSQYNGKVSSVKVSYQ
ncbi:hypothetical protein SAMN05216262_104101 [Colwellia chukchiensis]|uniref:MSHA biogenesis protein MshF n=1 Tax=Colwellia chukchiensis TaxID=641665 RepID=A0A1H7LAN6_9GAMM|nr:hypothetical protein [Colwellia chukchiensis]SEK95958.1 hypothetical protein SAMN05216262_104101 [Colwellia chukchiensis]